MRPQRFAADHHLHAPASNCAQAGFNEAAAIRCGSPAISATNVSSSEASMRPQRFAADHGHGLAWGISWNRASMRPQRFAADHVACRLIPDFARLGFNEAAAIRCGSPTASQKIETRIQRLQ